MSVAENSQSEPEHQTNWTSSRLAKAILAFFVGLTILMLSGVACFYFLYHKLAQDPVERMAGALSDVFGTEVVVSGSTAVLAKAEIGELALVQRKTQAITKFQTTWLGSEKTLIVRADFIIKAGFDLSEGGQWGILDGVINGPMPRAKVLSVEPQGDFEVYYAENGAINRLNSEDHARAFNYLKNQARKDAERSDITTEAERLLLRRIKDRMGEVGEKLTWHEELVP